MVRVISVLVATLVLLGVGWFVGHRPVERLQASLDRQTEACARERQDLEARVRDAEARATLWSAHAALLRAARDVEARNFGTASEAAEEAAGKITQVAGWPGVTFHLGEVSGLVGSARARISALDGGAAEALKLAAAELTRILEKVGQA